MEFAILGLADGAKRRVAHDFIIAIILSKNGFTKII